MVVVNKTGGLRPPFIKQTKTHTMENEHLVNWIHFDGANAVDEACKWIHKQIGWPEKSVRFYLLNYGIFRGEREGFEILRATMFDTHAKGVEVSYDPNCIDIKNK